MVRCGWRGRLTAEGRARKGPLEAAHWGVTRGERRRAGPHLWEAQIEPWNTEGRRCTYSRSLAAAGIATWAEITNKDTGEWLNAKEAGEIYGLEQDGVAEYRTMACTLHRCTPHSVLAPRV